MVDDSRRVLISKWPGGRCGLVASIAIGPLDEIFTTGFRIPQHTRSEYHPAPQEHDDWEAELAREPLVTFSWAGYRAGGWQRFRRFTSR